MLLLLLFALIAGAGTAITPCVLPVLPALLSASAAGGRRRPLGIVLGLAVTFTIAIVALGQLVKGVGLAGGAARTLAIVVLIAFGLVLLLPGVAERVQAPLSRLARFGPRTRGTGFWSGLGVGAALGFVCAPCAGPILAAVISVSASGGASAKVVAVALAYAAGLSARAAAVRTRRPGRPGAHAPFGARRRGRARVWASCCWSRGSSWPTNLDVRFEEALARGHQPARRSSSIPTRVAGELTTPSRTAWRRCARPRGSPSARTSRRPWERPAGLRRRGRDRRRQDARRCPSSGPRPSSPGPSDGSTPPAGAR